MARSKKVRAVRLEPQAHREAEDRLRRAYRQLWQACWEEHVLSQERCEDGKESRKRVTIKTIIEIESQVVETITNKTLVIPHIRVAGCGLNKGDRVKITIERVEPK